MKKLKLALLTSAILGISTSALADSSAATGAITTAQTDAVAVAGALVAMGVAVWGAMFLYRKFFK